MNAKALNLFLPIKKVDEAARLVYGVLSAEVPDKAGEIMDYATGKEQFQKWSDAISKASGGKSKGNVRAMHGKVAAGVMKDIFFNDAEKSIEGCAHVVDDQEWKKVLSGTYTGFSIGGSYEKRWPDETDPTLTRYTPVLSEVSIVDNPCVGIATFSVVKADGTQELRKFQTGEADLSELEQVWKAVDGSTHKTKAAAVNHNATLAAEKLLEPVKAALAKVDETITGAEGEPETPPTEAPAPEEKTAETETPPAEEPTAEPAPVEPAADAAETLAEKLAKAAVDGKVALGKGLYDVGCVADAIAQLKDTQFWLENDAKWGDGDMSVSDELAAKIKGLLDFLKTLVAAEADALAASAGTDGLEKVVAERDALAKGIEGFTATISTLQKRLEALEAQPQVPLAHVRVLGKGDETGSVSDADVVAALEKMTPQEIQHSLMKAALRTPMAK